MPPAEGDAPPTIAAGRHRPSLVLFLLLATAVLAADLIVKEISFARVAQQPVELSAFSAEPQRDPPPHPAILVAPKLLAFKLTLNRGAAFGLGQGGRWVFIVVALVAVTAISVVFARSRSRDRLLHIALALLLGGAIGNLYDRIVYGVVRDMFWMFPDVRLPFGWRWPGGNDQLYPWIFNVADAAMCVALAVLGWMVLFTKSDEQSSKPRGH